MTNGACAGEEGLFLSENKTHGFHTQAYSQTHIDIHMHSAGYVKETYKRDGDMSKKTYKRDHTHTETNTCTLRDMSHGTPAGERGL